MAHKNRNRTRSNNKPQPLYIGMNAPSSGIPEGPITDEEFDESSVYSNTMRDACINWAGAARPEKFKAPFEFEDGVDDDLIARKRDAGMLDHLLPPAVLKGKDYINKWLADAPDGDNTLEFAELTRASNNNLIMFLVDDMAVNYAKHLATIMEASLQTQLVAMQGTKQRLYHVIDKTIM